MSLPPHHILPPSAFRHIGIMVLFMYAMAAFSLLGFLSVKDITRGWTTDFKDNLTFELPAFDTEMEYVFDETRMAQDLNNITEELKGDPLVSDIQIIHDDALKTGIEDLDIPAPYFITLSLKRDRAENAEERLINNIRQIVPHILIHEHEEWEMEIRHTAFIFQTVFCGLALSIFVVTAIILSGVIRTQLRASDETVKLIHLLGAQVKTIAGLFKNSVTRAVIWGVVTGGILTAILLSSLLVLLGLEDHLYEFYIYLIITGLLFISLCRLITYRTVLSSLKGLP